MQRRVWMIAGTVVTLSGCFGGELDNSSSFHNVPVDTSQAEPASMEVAARVDQVGRRLLAQNPFLGVEPTFHTLGKKESELFHRDTSTVFITEGLARRCADDEELAAVLAGELSRMVAARRIADRMRLPDAMDLRSETAGQNGNGAGADLNDLGVQAVFNQSRTRPREKAKSNSENADLVAQDILKSAGIDPKVLQKVQPYVEAAAQNNALARQFGVQGDRPQWSR